MTRVALPAIIVVLVVAAYVGASGWNRSGEPQLITTVTERELPLRFAPGSALGDDTGLRLWIRYQERADPLDARNWLPESRLREIGFPFNVPVAAPQAVDAYARVPPRTAWVVFEYDGPQSRAFERRRALQGSTHFPDGALHSRLVPVDAAPEFEALRRRYPTGHLILPGVIGLVFVGASEGGPMVYGTLRELVPQAVTVPPELRSRLDRLLGPEPHVSDPRYEVDLAVGRLGLPYVRDVRMIGGDGPRQ